MRHPLPVLLLLCLLPACGKRADTVVGPQPVQDLTIGEDKKPLSASLARRVAEAADGYRDDRIRYVAADRKHPHKVIGVFLDSTAAIAAARDSNRGNLDAEYAVFGPYRSIEDPPETSDTAEHVSEVTVRMKNGKTKTFGADTVDALFWSVPAFDKFVAPYLTVVSGAEEAAKQRRLYLQGKSRLTHSTAIPHKRGSL